MDQTNNQVVCSNAAVVDATTLLASPSQPNKLDARRIPVVGKIPVVISEADVQIYVDATVQLEEDALDITRVTKNVILTRCQMLLTDDKKSSKVLLNGYVKKNIEYSIPRHVHNDAVRGDIHFTTVNIPFKCFAKIDFIAEPVTAFNPQVLTSSSSAMGGMGNDPSSVSIMNSEILNERIYVELMQTKIRDIDVKKGVGEYYPANGKFASENTFRTFSDSMIIELKLRVIQNQSVEFSLQNAFAANQGSNGQQGNGGKSGNSSEQGNGEAQGNGSSKGNDKSQENAKSQGGNENGVNSSSEQGSSSSVQEGRKDEGSANESSKAKDNASEQSKDNDKSDNKKKEGKEQGEKQANNSNEESKKAEGKEKNSESKKKESGNK